MRRLKKVLLYVMNLTTKLINFKKEKIIIFESIPEFYDNSGSLHKEIIKQKLNYKIYWVSYNSDKNCNKENIKIINTKFSAKNIFNYLKSLYIMTIADYCFFTHSFIGNVYNKNQIRCFLMHGTSLKNLKNIYNNMFNGTTHAIVTSKFTEKIHTMTKKGIENKCLILGYPRNDDLFILPTLKKQIKQDLNFLQFKKIILWLPTFKHNKNSNRNDFGKDISSDINIINDEIYKKLNNILQEKNIVLAIKPHPGQDMNYFQIKESDNIKIITDKILHKNNFSLQNLMAVSDALITDFSSAYVDYMLIDKPIAFELTEIDNYQKGVGFIVENPLDYMPGNIIKSGKDMLDFIQEISENKDFYKKERDKIKNLYHKYQDNKSSKRIIKYFKLGGNNNEKI